MSEQFKVGEIAIYQNSREPSNNGKECEIIGGLEYRGSHHPITKESFGDILCYRTRRFDGTVIHSEPHQLRKKQPPRSAKSIMREAILKAQQPAKVPA